MLANRVTKVILVNKELRVIRVIKAIKETKVL